MLYLAWDREINISLFFCDVFAWKWGPGLEQAAVVTMATRVLRPLKRAFVCIPPERLTACKIWRGGWKFSFPKMFNSYRDLFLNAYLSYPDISTFIDAALAKATNRYIYQISPKFLVNVILCAPWFMLSFTIKPKRRDWCRIFKCYYMIGERYIP